MHFEPITAVYKYPQETWNKAKCKKLIKQRHTDGLGTPFPRGYVDYLIPASTRYNGCVEIDGELYAATERTLPLVADGFKLVLHVTWGYFLERTSAV